MLNLEYLFKTNKSKRASYKNKYRTLEIFAHKIPANENILYIDHYRISFCDYYKTSRVNGEDVIIEMKLFWNQHNLNHNCDKVETQRMINQICESKEIDSKDYDLFKGYISGAKSSNEISKSCEGQNKIMKEVDNIFKDEKRIIYSRIEYISKDLNLEELDAIIYPEEYTNFKY
ncbi:MAG: hypothetical protein GY756_01195 [bacterium]|nr:hypothetical protein [bacterium]